MAQIDNSVYTYRSMLGNPTQSFNQGMRMGDMMNQRKLQAEEREKLRMKENNIKHAFSSNMIEKPDGSVGFNEKNLIRDLYQVDPQLGINTYKEMQARQNQDRQFNFQKTNADRNYGLQRDRLLFEKSKLNQKNSNPAANLTVGEKQVDQEFGKDYAKWAGGGFSNVKGNLQKLKGALAKIEDKDTEVGSTIMPEFIRARFNRDSVMVEQDIGNVVFQSLKEILGGQFTEKEGQKLVQQSYDSRLSDEQNAQKVRASLDKLQTMALAKQQAVEYFANNGTLKGFMGSNASTIDQFNKELKSAFLEDKKSNLTAGHTEDGYFFKGGDPADPNNWSEIRSTARGGE